MLHLLVILLVVGSAIGEPGCTRPGIPYDGEIHDSKIINGVPAYDGQFPYMASLRYVGGGHACGASILTPTWVLTAAQCCLTGYPLEIYVGSISLSRDGKSYPISRYLYHGEYNASDDHRKNDICLIATANPIEFNSNVRSVALPSKNFEVPSGSSLTIPGWGAITGGGETDILQVLNGDIAMSNSECRSRTGVDIYDGQICVFGGDNRAVCGGDSGGPLSYNGVQVGLTSWGYLPCGGTGMPDIFTRVSFYVDWIQEVMGSDAKDLKFV